MDQFQHPKVICSHMEAFHNVDLQSNYHDQDEYKCIPEKKYENLFISFR